MLNNKLHQKPLLLAALAAFFFWVIFGKTPAFAATSDQQNAIQQNIQTQQRLEAERQNLIRQKEFEEINNIGKSKKERESLNKKPLNDDGVCKVVSKFIVTGNTKFSSWWLRRKFINDYQNKCLNKSDLKKIKDDIQNYYAGKGYILTRVYLRLNSINIGEVEILIEEGKLEKIELKDNSKINDKLSFRRKSEIFFAFPISSGDVINLRDIEQGIEQMNRLSSNSAVMDISAGSKDGYSNVTVNNNIKNTTELNLAIDNSGDKNTGRDKGKISLNQDNLFGINDNIYANYSLTNPSDKKERYSQSTYLSASVPFGYLTIGGSYSYSEYLVTTNGTTTSFRSTGNAESKSYYLDRVLKRGQKYKIALKAELEKSDNDSYLEDVYLPENSREFATANFYLSNIFYTNFGSIYLQPKYSKGLDRFNALKDGENLDKSDPRAQFNSYGLYGQLSANFKLPKTTIPANYKLTFDSSYSEDSLYSFKQFSIGGRYTVRGFQDSTISGDDGYYVRNDLTTAVLNLLPEKIKSRPIFNYHDILAKTNLGIFYDYGAIRNKVLNDDSDKGYMSGTGVKLDYQGKYLNWDLSYARALHTPKFIETQYRIKESQFLYFTVSMGFGV